MTSTVEKCTLPPSPLEPGRLRVLLITPFYGDGGGVGNCALELSAALRRLPVSVDVLHWWPNLSQPALVTPDGRRWPLSSLDDLLESKREYDLLHFESAAYADRFGGGLSKILARFEIPIVYTIHSLAAYHGEVMGEMDAMRLNIADQAELMARAHRVVLLTRDLVEIAARHHPEHAGKFVVIENGAAGPSISAEALARRAEIEARLGPRAGRTILLYVGRISREKGIYELAGALPGLVAAVPGARLVIAGNKSGDPNVAAIERRWADQGLAPGVHYDFVGWVDGAAKEALYALADYVIMPSHYEHMPLTALEAMAHRRLVIMSDIASLRETFCAGDPKRRCVLPIADIGDPAAIVAAVRAAVADPAEVGRIVERAHALVTSRFTWPRIAERTLALYREVRAERQAEEEARFARAFEARFKQIFDLTFEGTLAVRLGDHKRGAELLGAAFELGPDNRSIHGMLATALERRLLDLRAELAERPYALHLIAELQRCSELLRRVLYAPPEAEAAAPVSLVMPVFIKEAHERAGVGYLIEALASALAQDFAEPIDIIVVDDGSEVDVERVLRVEYGRHLASVTDEHGAVLHRGNGGEGRRMWLIRRRECSGNDVTPRNLAILAALRRGSRYIAHLDSDDRMVPDRLRTSFAYLEGAASTDLLHGRHRCIDAWGNLLTGSKVDGWYNFARKFTFGLDQHDPVNAGRSKRHGRSELDLLRKDNWIHGGTVIYRSNVVLRVGPENLAPTQRYGADHHYWQKISHVSTIDYLSHVLTEHRLHAGTMTQGGR